MNRAEIRRREIRKERAIELFLQGKLYSEIAEQLAPTTAAVIRRWVASYKKDHPLPDVETSRRMQITNYNKLIEALQPKVRAGNIDAISEQRQLMTRLDKLLQVDVPSSAGSSRKKPFRVEFTVGRKDKG